MKYYTDLAEIEKAIGYAFKNKELLITALTHPSASGENNYERLEFLGDAVLELSVSDVLYKKFNDSDEGALTKMRAGIVCSRSLSAVAAKLEINKHLILGKGEEATDGRNKTSILENAMEAIMGAVFLDSDYLTARGVVDKIFIDFGNTVYDYKTFLQEEVQKNIKKNIAYNLVSSEGPQHDMIFTSSVSIDGKVKGTGQGKSKKEAEQNAAKAAIENLNIKL